jgi:uncharacterized protein HemY
LAREAIDLVPANGLFWRTLGVAYYRTGSWKEAVVALTRSAQLGCETNGYGSFFLAMAHWHLGEKEQAGRWLGQAVQWMDKFQPNGKELGRVRSEAAELVKVQPKKD